MSAFTPARPASARIAASLRDLQRIPGIGPNLAKDLVDLGIQRIADLRRRIPERLYQQLCELRGKHQDRCVLYAFRCAVYFASEKEHDPERLKWWTWKDAKDEGKRGVRGKLPRAVRRSAA